MAAYVGRADAPLGDQTPGVVLLDFSKRREQAVDDLTICAGFCPTRRLSLNGACAHGFVALSFRQAMRLQCPVYGNSNKMIARRLHFTEAAIKVHQKSLFAISVPTSRIQAAIWALNNGLAPNIF